MRIGTWNVNYQGVLGSGRLGTHAHETGIDLMLLQAADPDALASFITHAGLDWVVTAWDAGAPALTTPGRRRVAAVAGRGPRPTSIGYLRDLDRPERMMFATIGSGPGSFTVASYHAPSGPEAGISKVDGAHILLDWVQSVDGPLILGADANTPKLDHPDPDKARTHWQTGIRKLSGRPGDDVMFGGRPEHDLEDAYRRYLSQNPGLLQSVALERPRGPLAVSHRTGRRLGSAVKLRRYDALWISRDFDVQRVDYDLESATRAGSDHALVKVDLTWDHE